MSKQNLKQPHDAERERAAAEARADLLRRAEQQGVKPFDFDAALGEGADGQTQAEIQAEVDEFLKLLRAWRRGGTRSIDA